MKVSAGTLALLREVVSTELPKVARLRFNRQAEVEAEALFREFLRGILKRELKSRRVLQDLEKI